MLQKKIPFQRDFPSRSTLSPQGGSITLFVFVVSLQGHVTSPLKHFARLVTSSLAPNSPNYLWRQFVVMAPQDALQASVSTVPGFPAIPEGGLTDHSGACSAPANASLQHCTSPPTGDMEPCPFGRGLGQRRSAVV